MRNKRGPAYDTVSNFFLTKSMVNTHMVAIFKLVRDFSTNFCESIWGKFRNVK